MDSCLQVRRLRIQQKIKSAEQGTALEEEEEDDVPEFPSSIPFLPPLVRTYGKISWQLSAILNPLSEPVNVEVDLVFNVVHASPIANAASKDADILFLHPEVVSFECGLWIFSRFCVWSLNSPDVVIGSLTDVYIVLLFLQTSATLKQYYATCFALISSIMLFAGLLSPIVSFFCYLKPLSSYGEYIVGKHFDGDWSLVFCYGDPTKQNCSWTEVGHHKICEIFFLIQMKLSIRWFFLEVVESVIST